MRFFGAEPRALYAVGMLAFFDVMIKSLVVTAPIYLRTELELGQMQLVMLVGTGIAGALAGLAWASPRMIFRFLILIDNSGLNQKVFYFFLHLFAKGAAYLY